MPVNFTYCILSCSITYIKKACSADKIFKMPLKSSNSISPFTRNHSTTPLWDLDYLHSTMRMKSCQQTPCNRRVSTLLEVKDDDGCGNNDHVIIGHYPLPLYCTKLCLLLARHLAHLILSQCMNVIKCSRAISRVNIESNANVLKTS
jgi:hypothetical protein